MFAIVIDLRPLSEFFSLPTDIMIIKILFLFGWIPIAFAFLWGAREVWLSYVRGQFGAQQKFMLLAIDIPRANMQSPKAVENIITYLAGAHGTINILEKYWDGKYQVSLSLEIVSIDGYTQFIVYTPSNFRDLVESAIYSQYPDAEITEIDDYTKGYPTKFPDDEYDVWGAEFIQAKKPVYPIKVYEEFMHQFGKPEEYFRDPMAALMDLCSSLRKGEQLWYQIIIVPEAFDCMLEKGDQEIRKILGEKIPPSNNIADSAVDLVLGGLSYFSSMILGTSSDAKEEKKDEPMKMMNLKPKEKKMIEAIQRKMSQLHFGYKSRMVYMAKKEVMQKPKVVNGFVGYLKQFMDIDLNNIKPDMTRTGTSPWGFFKTSRTNSRKRNIVKNYMSRNDTAGSTYGYLSIEEIATLWHFPVDTAVKAPMIQKVAGRKSQPPSSLPFDTDNIQEERFDATRHRMEMDNVFSGDKIGQGSAGLGNLPFADSSDDIIEEEENIFTEAMAEEKPVDLKKDKPMHNKGEAPPNLPFV